LNSTQFTGYQFDDYSLAIESGIDISLVAETFPRQASEIASAPMPLDISTTSLGGSTGSNLNTIDLILSRDLSNYDNLNGDNLNGDNQGLKLTWQSSAIGELNFVIDVHSIVNQHHSFPIPKQGALNQALGKKSKSIIDASGGWGSDALLMAMQGYQVTVIERQPLMALLLQDAFDRFARIEWVQNNEISIPSMIFDSSQNRLLVKTVNADCVYFDPMFPPKRKKSAGVNKQMQLLQWLVGQDSDAVDVLKAALAADVPRVAVKRPAYAAPLLENPSAQFSSKLVNYDVYLNSY